MSCVAARTLCLCDYALGAVSRDALTAFVAQGPLVIRRTGIDKYGRTLALISVNGVNAGDWLVTHHFARRWF